MIAAFWSSAGGSVGVTTNLACFGSYYAARFQRKVMAFENHMPKHVGLEQALIPKREPRLIVREEPFYYDYRGMEQLLKILRAGYEPESIDQISISLLNDCLRYLPLSEQMCSSVYEYELNIVIEQLLQELDRRNDLVLVDTQAAENLTTKVILEQADLVVVNLLQEPGQIEEFWEQYAGLKEKAVFLLGRYREENVYNRTNVSRMYGIPRERIWVMPEYPLLSFLYEQGKIPDFLQKNLWASVGEKNYALIRELRYAAETLRAWEKEGRSV